MPEALGCSWVTARRQRLLLVTGMELRDQDDGMVGPRRRLPLSPAPASTLHRTDKAGCVAWRV